MDAHVMNRFFVRLRIERRIRRDQVGHFPELSSMGFHRGHEQVTIPWPPLKTS
jgi:hypothetical protein